MRPAVYPPVTLEGRPSANENSSLQFDQELGESAGLLPGLYKPAVSDPQHDTWISSFRACSSEERPPSPTELLGRAAQVPGPGQESSTPFSHVNAAQTSASRWKHPCQSQQPFIVQNHGLRVRLPQASHALTGDLVANGVGIALQRYTAQPNAHLHGGAGVIYKQSFYDWYKQGNQCDWYKQSCQCMIQI